MEKTNLTTLDILSELIRNYKHHTIILTGRPGPTGKTWLYNHLKQTNFFKSVIEISDVLESHYDDEQNHLIECEECVVVVLNKLLPGYIRS